MIRAALATLAVIMATVCLYQGYAASWHTAWLLALTFATGVMAGLLGAVAILVDRAPQHSRLSNGETHDAGQDP